MRLLVPLEHHVVQTPDGRIFAQGTLFVLGTRILFPDRGVKRAEALSEKKTVSASSRPAPARGVRGGAFRPTRV